MIRDIQKGDIEYAIEHGLEESEDMTGFKYEMIHGKTCVIDGRIIFTGGVFRLEEGVGEIWVVMTKDFLSHVIEAYRVMRDEFILYLINNGYETVRAIVHVEFPQAGRMLKHLGFEQQELTEPEKKTIAEYTERDMELYVYRKAA